MDNASSNPKAAEAWREAIRLVAAYRDQQHVTTTNPLGPYPEEHRAGHDAYWRTLTQLLTTGNPTPPTETIDAATQHQIQRDITTHTWTTLTPAQKADVLAHLQLSTNTQIPAEVDTDMLTRHPATTTALLNTLTHQGHALWTPHQPPAWKNTEDAAPDTEQPHQSRQRDVSPKALGAGGGPLRRPTPTVNIDIQPRQRLLSEMPLHYSAQDSGGCLLVGPTGLVLRLCLVGVAFVTDVPHQNSITIMKTVWRPREGNGRVDRAGAPSGTNQSSARNRPRLGCS